MLIDHVVLWVADPERALAFYERVVGLSALRVDEWRAHEALFPSVRVSPGSLLDLVPRSIAGRLEQLSHAPGSGGHTANHVCLALTPEEYAGLAARLDANGVVTSALPSRSFGARGFAAAGAYFTDPDGNVIEARCYSAPEENSP